MLDLSKWATFLEEVLFERSDSLLQMSAQNGWIAANVLVDVSSVDSSVVQLRISGVELGPVSFGWIECQEPVWWANNSNFRLDFQLAFCQ